MHVVDNKDMEETQIANITSPPASIAHSNGKQRAHSVISKDTPKSIENEEEEYGNILNKMNQLQHSGSTGLSSLGSKYPNAKEVSESYSTVLLEMKWCFLSLVVNSSLLFFINIINGGFRIDISKDVATTFGCVIIEVLLLITNIVTFMALNSGCAAFFGSKIVSKRGYSMAVCGFHQQGLS